MVDGARSARPGSVLAERALEPADALGRVGCCRGRGQAVEGSCVSAPGSPRRAADRSRVEIFAADQFLAEHHASWCSAAPIHDPDSGEACRSCWFRRCPSCSARPSSNLGRSARWRTRGSPSSHWTRPVPVTTIITCSASVAKPLRQGRSTSMQSRRVSVAPVIELVEREGSARVDGRGVERRADHPSLRADDHRAHAGADQPTGQRGLLRAQTSCMGLSIGGAFTATMDRAVSAWIRVSCRLQLPRSPLRRTLCACPPTRAWGSSRTSVGGETSAVSSPARRCSGTPTKPGWCSGSWPGSALRGCSER